jgi:hypothetical protein
VAREHIAALEPRLSRIEFRVSEAADIEDLVIARKGTTIPRAAWSVAMPFDAGDHQFDISAPGYEPTTVHVRVEGEGQVVVFEVPVLKKAPPEALPPEAAQESDQKAVVIGQPAEDTESGASSSVQRIVGWALVGGGAIAAGAGTYFGLRAMSLSKKTKEQCPETVCGVPELEQDYEKAGTAATNSNIAFISAGVLVTAGVVTLLTSKSPQRSVVDTRGTRFAVSPARAGAQLHLMGEF